MKQWRDGLGMVAADAAATVAVAKARRAVYGCMLVTMYLPYCTGLSVWLNRVYTATSAD